MSNYNVGQKYVARVTGIADYGLFITIDENDVGLVFYKNIPKGKNKYGALDELYKKGDQVKVKFLGTNERGQLNFAIHKKPNREKKRKGITKRKAAKLKELEELNNKQNTSIFARMKNFFSSLWGKKQEINNVKDKKITEKPMPRNKTSNLNTRDVKDSDLTIREMETILFEGSEDFDNPKIAVLELSTKAVKLLMGRDQDAIMSSPYFSFDLFKRMARKTETGKGLDENNVMNMNYFKSRVLPAIREMKRQMKSDGVETLYTVATAAYRTAQNREEIVELIREETGINVCILSKQEEAKATLFAYACSTKRKAELNQSKYVIMIDQGGGSTEVSIFEEGEFVFAHSINLGTTALHNLFFQGLDRELPLKDALQMSDKKTRERLQTFYPKLENLSERIKMQENYCVGVGSAITLATGKQGNKKQHDIILSKQNIKERILGAEQLLLDEFPTIGALNDVLNYYTSDTKDQAKIEDALLMRLGLPLFVELMDSLNISYLNVSGTGLWYGVYLQKLFDAE